MPAIMPDLQANTPIKLQCGLTLPNRLAKAAMAEHLADKFMPSATYINLYRLFADGGWGMVLTGNVQVDVRYLGNSKDIAFDESVGKAKLLEAWKASADFYKDKKTALIMQLNHAGRQSVRGDGRRSLWTQTMAPSPLPLKLGNTWFAALASALVFGTPREMNHDDIAEVTRLFVDAAVTAHEAGYAGVQIHGAHGYLLSQFLSSKGNVRTDAYGGTPAKRAKFVVDIIRAVRCAVPASFCVGVKLNSVDHQSEQDMAACLEQLELIIAAGVDFIEVSGGDYGDPQFMKGDDTRPVEKSARTKAREAFFLEFAKGVRARFPSTPLMVTGGFSSRLGIEAAIAEGDCDLVGLGRPAAVNQALPNNIIFNSAVADQDATVYRKKMQALPWIVTWLGIGNPIGAGTESAWYTEQMEAAASKH